MPLTESNVEGAEFGFVPDQEGQTREGSEFGFVPDTEQSSTTGSDIGRARSIWGSFVQGAAGATEKAAQFFGRLQAPVNIPGVAMTSMAPSETERLNKALRSAPQEDIDAFPGIKQIIGASKAVKEAFPTNPKYSQEFWSGKAPAAIGSAVGTLPYALANPAAPFIVGFGAEAQDAFDRELKRQKDAGEKPDNDKALFKGTLYGIGSSAIEYKLGTGYLMRKIADKFGNSGIEAVADAAKSGWSNVLGKLKDSGKGGLAGYVEEASQEVLEGMIVEGEIDLKKVHESGLAGIVGQGGVSLAISAIPSRATTPKTESPESIAAREMGLTRTADESVKSETEAPVKLPEGVTPAGHLTHPTEGLKDQYHLEDKEVGKQTFIVPAGSGIEVINAEVARTKERYKQAASEAEQPATTQEPTELDIVLSKATGGTENVAADLVVKASVEGEAGLAKLKAASEKAQSDFASSPAPDFKKNTQEQNLELINSRKILSDRSKTLKEAYDFASGNPTPNSPGDQTKVSGVLHMFKKGASDASTIESPIRVVSNEPSGPPAQVAEGTPGSLRQPERAPETKAQVQQAQVAPPAPPAAPVSTLDRPGGSAVGIKNAEMNRVRQELGIPPLDETLGKPDQALWNEVMDRIDRQPDWQNDLVKELKENPRGHTDVEALALDHRLVELRTEHAKAAREAIKAKEEGRLDDAAEAGQRADQWIEKIRELSEITKASGTILGRALRSRQLMMDEDFSPSALELKKRQANGWQPLTEEQRQEIQKTHAEYAQKTAELEAHLVEQKGKLVDAEIKLAQSELSKGPQYDPRLLKLAENVAGWMDTQAVSALERIKARRAGKVRLDPTLGAADLVLDIADASIVGAAKIARKVSDFAKWSVEMKRDLGDWVNEHLPKIWEASQAQFEKTADERLRTESAGTKSKVKNSVTGKDAATKIEEAKAKIGAKVEKGEADSIFHSVQKLVRGIVERDPSITREPLIDEVHGVLKQYLPEITRIEAMDAISGRGRFTIPPQDQASRTIRDLKTQTRLVAHAMDVEAGRPLPMTGFKHDKPSDIARNLEAQLNELKRKFGVVVTDPAKQLVSVLTARKTYYKNRLTDLKLEIQTRERIVKEKTPSPTDPELNALIEEYNVTKTEHDHIFQHPELTDAQRLAMAEKSAERQIAQLEQQLKDQSVFPSSKKKLGVTSQTLEANRARIEALKAERQWMRESLKPKPDIVMQALAMRRAQMSRQIANYQQRIADGDYAPRTRKAPVDITQDEYAMKLKAELEQVKRDFDKGLMLDEAKRRTKLQKGYAAAKETVNLPKAIWSSFDLSAVGRQGGWIGMGNPIRAAKSIKPMLDAVRSEKMALIEEQKILNRPNAQNGNYAKAKLYIASLNEFRLTRQEEIMMSQFANLIPGVRMSNRAFMTYLNKLRADSFDAMLKSRESWFSAPVDAKELNALANYVNVATGRGDLGKAAAAAEALSSTFWSPRLVAGRFQLLLGQPFFRGTNRTRAVIAAEYAKSLTGMAVVLGLGAIMGADIETDRNSSDFLKLRFGNTRVDVLGGLIQNTVLLSRLQSGTTTTSSGKQVPAKSVQTIGNFLRNKLTPALGMGLDVRDIATGQKPPPGHPQSVGELAAGAVVPLSFRDLKDLMVEQGVPAGTAIQMLSIFGAGVQNYQDKKSESTGRSYTRTAPVTRAAAQP